MMPISAWVKRVSCVCALGIGAPWAVYRSSGSSDSRAYGGTPPPPVFLQNIDNAELTGWVSRKILIPDILEAKY